MFKLITQSIFLIGAVTLCTSCNSGKYNELESLPSFDTNKATTNEEDSALSLIQPAIATNISQIQQKEIEDGSTQVAVLDNPYLKLELFPTGFTNTYNNFINEWYDKYKPGYFIVTPKTQICNLRIVDEFKSGMRLYFNGNDTSNCRSVGNKCYVHYYEEANKVPFNTKGSSELHHVNMSFQEPGSSSDCAQANGEFHNFDLPVKHNAVHDANLKPVFGLENNPSNMILVSADPKYANKLILNQNARYFNFSIGYLGSYNNEEIDKLDFHNISYSNEKVCPAYSAEGGKKTITYSPLVVNFINPYSTAANFSIDLSSVKEFFVNPHASEMKANGVIPAQTEQKITLCLPIKSHNSSVSMGTGFTYNGNIGVKGLISFTSNGNKAGFELSSECKLEVDDGAGAGSHDQYFKQDCDYHLKQQGTSIINTYKGINHSLGTTFKNMAPAKSLEGNIYAESMEWKVVNLDNYDKSKQFESILYQFTVEGRKQLFSGCNYESGVGGGEACKLQYYINKENSGDFPTFLELNYLDGHHQKMRQFFPLIIRFGSVFSPNIRYGFYGEDEFLIEKNTNNKVQLSATSYFREHLTALDYKIDGAYWSVFANKSKVFDSVIACRTNDCFNGSNFKSLNDIHFGNFWLDAQHRWGLFAKYKDPVSNIERQDKIFTVGQPSSSNYIGNIGKSLPFSGDWYKDDVSSIDINYEFKDFAPENFNDMFGLAPQTIVSVAPIIDDKIGKYSLLYTDPSSLWKGSKVSNWNLSHLYAKAYVELLGSWNSQIVERPIAIKVEFKLGENLLHVSEVICYNLNNIKSCKGLNETKSLSVQYEDYKFVYSLAPKLKENYNVEVTATLQQMNQSSFANKYAGKVILTAPLGNVDSGDSLSVEFGKVYKQWSKFNLELSNSVGSDLTELVFNGYKMALKDFNLHGQTSNNNCKLIGQGYNEVTCDFKIITQAYSVPASHFLCKIAAKKGKEIKSLNDLSYINCSTLEQQYFMPNNWNTSLGVFFGILPRR
jgi:hypothetical protein